MPTPPKVMYAVSLNSVTGEVSFPNLLRREFREHSKSMYLGTHHAHPAEDDLAASSGQS